jgi:hypothetical protein
VGRIVLLSFSCSRSLAYQSGMLPQYNAMMLTYLLNDKYAGSETIKRCQRDDKGWSSIMSTESCTKVFLSIMITCKNVLAAMIG